MSGRGIGTWWDPGDGDAAGAAAVAARGPGLPQEVRRRAERRERSSAPRSSTPAARPTGPPPGAAGLTGEPVLEKAPSRWWWVGAGLLGVLAVVSAVLAVVGRDVGWAALAGASTLSAVLLVVAEGREPRRVSGSEAGVEVATRRSTVQLRWDELRRVRSRDVVGFDHVDLHLERDRGDLLKLPRRTPGGLVEAWRHRFGGGRPVEALPQVWRLSAEERQAQGLGFGRLMLAYLPLLVLNGLLRAVDVDLPLFVAVYLIVLCGLALAWSRFSRPPAWTVDADALRRPGRRRRSTPWSEVRDVRRQGRYDPGAVLVLASGEEVQVGLDEQVVRGWWHLAVPPEDREPTGG